MSLFNRHKTAATNSNPVQAPADARPAISFEKVAETAPGLVSLAKSAAVSLDKHGLNGQRAAVYLVLDHSGSMASFYRNGDVQHLAEQALGLSANLDDDGLVPVILFDHEVHPAYLVDLIDYRGAVDRARNSLMMGGTRYAPAIRAVVEHYTLSGATDPALVIFQSDGEPEDRDQTVAELRAASRLPIFWATVGFGSEHDLTFLRALDTLTLRVVDNASFFHAADPQHVTDADLYDGITGEFAQWLTAARAAGVLR